MLPDRIAGVRIPDSKIARAAQSEMAEALPPFLFNHSVRSYVFGALENERRGLAFDEEIAFVAALMHDAGLVSAYASPGERFEIDGADAARRLLLDHDVELARAELAWDAIALHACGSIPFRKAPEIAMLAIGTSWDVAGLDYATLDPALMAQILHVLPRLDFKLEIVASFLAYAESKPMAQLFTITDGLLRSHAPHLAPPTLEAIVARAPFAE